MDMDGPALAPPDGVIPNLDNPENKNWLAWFVLVLLAVISTICVLLRGYARVFLLRLFRVEEALIISAYGIFWGCLWSSFGLIYTPGYYVHQWDVRLKDTIPMTYLIFVMGNTYVVVLMLLKVAMLLEWSRILVPKGSRYNSIFWWGCVIMMSVQIAWGIGATVAMNLQCIPHVASWDFTVAGKCFPLYTLQLSSGIFYLVSDITMFFMPHHIIWGLQMSWQKRLGVSVVFGLGLMACVAAAFRLQVTITYGHATDSTYRAGDLVFWVFAEMTCGFFIVCMPCLPKILIDAGILAKMKTRFGMRTGGSKSAKNGYYGSTAVSSTGKLTTITSKSYRMLDDESVAMGDLKASESTEHLRQDKLTPSNSGIMRTTRITVNKEQNRDDHANSEPGSYNGPKAGWGM